jgi:hypothetical protein
MYAFVKQCSVLQMLSSRVDSAMSQNTLLTALLNFTCCRAADRSQLYKTSARCDHTAALAWGSSGGIV